MHQRPLELGADAVVHSTTKYLGGHSDTVGGAAIMRDPALHEKVKFVQNAVGAVPGPFDCFLVHRGLRTLHLRVAAHDANGLAVSGWLREHAGVADVRWPGFGGMVSFRHPEAVRFTQLSIGAVPGPIDCFLVHRGLRTLHLRMAAHAENGMAVSAFLREQPGVSDVRWPGFSGMVCFRHPDAVRIVAATRLFALAESLGGVESLIEVPQAMTHQSVEGSAAAVPADLVRLSCGIEAAADLVEDLRRALATVQPSASPDS